MSVFMSMAMVMLLAVQEMPTVPQELWNEYAGLLQETPAFQVASALKPAEVAKKLEEWSVELDMKVQSGAWSTLDSLVRESYTGRAAQMLATTPADAKAPEDLISVETLFQEHYNQGHTFGFVSAGAPDRRGRTMTLALLNEESVNPQDRFGLGVTPAEGQETVYYRVPPQKLLPWTAPTIAEIVILHPSNDPLASFSVSDESLNKVVETLAARGRLDYSIRADLAGRHKVSLSVRGRSAAEILDLAAVTSGWSVRYAHDSRDILPAKEEARSSPADERITFADIVALYHFRDRLNRPGPGPRIETPMDALRALVVHAAGEMKATRPIAILTPVQPTAP